MPADARAIDPVLVEAWLRARSRARGLPQPVADRGGLRVDTGAADEEARYVFAAPLAGLSDLGREILRPRVLLKLCGTEETMRRLLPERWHVRQSGHVMVRPALPAPPAPVPRGFRLEIATEAETTSARIVADNGRLAASGHAAEFAGVFIYDRIRTEEPFRRQGLGRALIAALGAARRSAESREILVATEAGRALYAGLGWRDYSPYTTAAIPG